MVEFGGMLVVAGEAAAYSEAGASPLGEEAPSRRVSEASWPLSLLDRRHFVQGLGGVLTLSAGLSACSAGPSVAANLKLTFYARVDGRVSKFSGVRKIVLRDVSAFPNPGSNLSTNFIGDAVSMGFGNGRTVFALLVESRGRMTPETIIDLWDWDCLPLLDRGYGRSMAWVGNDCPGLRQLVAAAPTSPIEIPVMNFPTLVTFDDLLRPETGRVLDPREDLSSLGLKGGRIERLELQVVNEPIDRTAAAQLPWLRPGLKHFSSSPAWNDFREHPEYFSR
ncbi:MAG TPA: hypothetical protein VN113_05965 [Caulobacter sp.]|nr:hypothetical protein [Caulobacter sp.]